MPQQTILPVVDPMSVIREMQKPRRHTQTLEDVESLQALRLNNAIIKVVMNNKLRCASIHEMRKRIPEFVVFALVPHSAVVVALDKPQLVGGVGTDLVHLAVVADEGFEFAAEIVALNLYKVSMGLTGRVCREVMYPVRHVAAERCAGGDSARGVDVGDVVTDMIEDGYEVRVGRAAPVCLYLG